MRLLGFVLLGLLLGGGALAAVVLGLVRRLLGAARPTPVRPPERADLRPLLLVALPAFGLAGLVFTVAVAAPPLLARQHFPATPKQPIGFDHRVHVEQVGLDCAFCHRAADRGVTAGLPDLQQCMFCHQVPLGQGQDAIESEKVRQAWLDQRAIDWVRIHTLPDHSRFPHGPHTQAGIPCATCHGNVEQMSQVVQVRSLKMADCVACHQQTRAPTDCVACHY